MTTRAHRRAPVARLGLLGLVGAAACADGLPVVERIASVRPLAVRVDVEDPPGTDPVMTRAEALPLETAVLTPLFADPDGPLTAERITAEIEPVWIACNLQPSQGLLGCISEAVPLAVDDLVDCPPPDLTGFDPSTGELPTQPSPCRIPADDPAQPTYTVPIDPTYLLGGDIEVTMVGHRPDESSTSSCLEALLGGGNPDDGCLYTTQRLAVGPDAALLELAEQFGVPDSALPPGPDEVPDADRNPRITELRVAAFEGQAEDAPSLGTFVPAAGEVIELPWGARLEIEAEASPDDLQTYLVVGDAGNFSERTEYFEGSWFVTWGGLLAPKSDDPLSQNTWTLEAADQDETDVPETGIATLIYVLRDDRQGVTWTHFQVRVTGSPDDGT